VNGFSRSMQVNTLAKGSRSIGSINEPQVEAAGQEAHPQGLLRRVKRGACSASEE
jgi:hypothetical protein